MINQNKQDMVKITIATTQDTSSILAILQENLIDITNPRTIQDLSNKNAGFLIRNITRTEIETMIDDNKNHIILVAKKADEVLGYLIASRFSKVSITLQNGLIPCLNQDSINDFDKVIYHRQIAVKSGTKNIGRALMEKFLQESSKANYQNVVCRIIHKPIYNQKSISFHQSFGFDWICDVNDGNITAGVYKINCNSMGHSWDN